MATASPSSGPSAEIAIVMPRAAASSSTPIMLFPSIVRLSRRTRIRARNRVAACTNFAAVSIGWHEDVQDARDDIQGAIGRVKGGASGVLIITDMFGGTPSNLAMTFLGENKVEVITGVNLPMLIKLAGLIEKSDLLGVAREMREQGKNAIWVASDLLRGEKA